MRKPTKESLRSRSTRIILSTKPASNHSLLSLKRNDTLFYVILDSTNSNTAATRLTRLRARYESTYAMVVCIEVQVVHIARSEVVVLLRRPWS